MQPKQPLLLIGTKHNEGIVPEFITKRLDQVKSKIIFLDEIFKSNLEQNILGASILKNDPFFKKCQTQPQLITFEERFKKYRIGQYELLGNNIYMLATRDACHLAYNNLIDTMTKKKNVSYHNIDNQDILKSSLNDIHTKDKSKSFIESCRLREQHMLNSINEHTQKIKGDELIIVSVGSSHVAGLSKELEKRFTVYKICIGNFMEINKSQNNYSKSFIDLCTYPRTPEEQAKDEPKFKVALAQVLFALGKHEEVNSFNKEEIQIKPDTENIKIASALSKLIKLHEMLWTYNHEKKSLSITYPNYLKNKLDGMFGDLKVKKETFNSIIEKQRNQDSLVKYSM